MTTRIGAITYLVPDYDEAIASFTRLLGFELLEDKPLDDGKRWVLVAPPGGGPALLLAQASGPDQQAGIGRQAGGRVFLFLHTDDFDADYRALLARGVRFREEPRHEDYGTVAVFEDGYGTPWDLLQLRSPK